MFFINLLKNLFSLLCTFEYIIVLMSTCCVLIVLEKQHYSVYSHMYSMCTQCVLQCTLLCTNVFNGKML